MITRTARGKPPEIAEMRMLYIGAAGSLSSGRSPMISAIKFFAASSATIGYPFEDVLAPQLAGIRRNSGEDAALEAAKALVLVQDAVYIAGAQERVAGSLHSISVAEPQKVEAAAIKFQRAWKNWHQRRAAVDDLEETGRRAAMRSIQRSEVPA